MIATTIVGASGRMGRTLMAGVLVHPQLTLVGATDRADHASLGQDVGTLLETSAVGIVLSDDIDAAFRAAQVIVDFTAPVASLAHATKAAELGKALVIGTTGFTEAEMETLRIASQSAPIVYSPNMSVGVNLFWHGATALAQGVGEDYHIAIEETHHCHKLDAPSGTAKRLHTLVAHAAQRAPTAIPVVSHREGEVVGDHCVTFDCHGDTITLQHHAKDRRIFSDGALVAAQWAIRQSPGWYSMNDVLGITTPQKG
jgi:4-hydroxy-tetrahydrodipicolinate reductase